MGEDRLTSLSSAAAEAFAETAVRFAYLYGSAATGMARARSDIDVAVYLDPVPPQERVLDVTLDLAARLSGASGFGSIDLVVLNGAPLPLRGRIVRERIVLFSLDEPGRVEYESATLREFFDFEVHSRPLDEKLLRDIAEGRR